MSLVHAALVFSLFGPPAADRAGLAAAAAASGQPRECRALSKSRSGVRGRTIWSAARAPDLVAFCDLVARAQGQLATDPAAARASALRADELLPGRATPLVILARAALASGDTDGALDSFERARAIDSRSIEHPPALRDLALALRAEGRLPEAAEAYRALAPRADLLPTPVLQVSALLEAAHASMSVDGAKAAGAPVRLDEAVAYLREAEQRAASTGLEADVLLSLALVLDRSGDRAQADAALAEAGRVGASSRRGPFPWVAKAEDTVALEALALELGDRAVASRRWQDYLAAAGGTSPWIGAAHSRRSALAGKTRPAGKKQKTEPPRKKGKRPGGGAP